MQHAQKVSFGHSKYVGLYMRVGLLKWASLLRYLLVINEQHHKYEHTIPRVFRSKAVLALLDSQIMSVA